LANKACNNLLKFRSRSKFKQLALDELILGIEAIKSESSKLK
jgi:Ca2+-binding EF-hand superfamily protein